MCATVAEFRTVAIRMSYGTATELLTLSKKEAELAEEIAKHYGLSTEEATTLVVKACIARRMKKRTGKGPAKVYSIRKR